MSEQTPAIVGIFQRESDLLSAAKEIQSTGISISEAYSPVYIDGLHEAIHPPDTRIGLAALVGGAVGAAVGFGMQTYAHVYSYPFNVGGRPLFSWPSFIPITFELTVLVSTLVALGTFLYISGLPRLHFPIFEAAGFERVSQDRFALAVSPQNDESAALAHEILAKHGAAPISEVAPC